MAPARSSRPSVSVLPQPQSPSLPSANNNNNTLADLPPISAIFLIDFDVKAGYTIVWKRAVPGLELDGLVEYKSLPSGLHTVTDDLIYFVHEGGHAGLSAFVNEPCEEAEARHARMIAVGILVPLSYGRLGRGWRHAQGLKEMAAYVATQTSTPHLLPVKSNRLVESWPKIAVKRTCSKSTGRQMRPSQTMLPLPPLRLHKIARRQVETDPSRTALPYCHPNINFLRIIPPGV